MDPASSDPSPLNVAGCIAALCRQFEKAWRAAENPRLEDYLDKLPEKHRPALSEELQRLELDLLFGHSERPAAQDLYGQIHLEQPRIDAIRPDNADMQPVSPSDSDAAGAPVALQQLGDFRILREVGQGGMGIVYEAEQVSLGRRVALKVLPRRMLLDTNARRRFEREARAAAQLHHTNIVPVFGVGDHDGLPYYVMQFINGLGLDVWRPLSLADHPRRVAGIGKQVAEALAYAHQQGIVHRDIKPSNLLLDEDGVVWVTDFGLAKADDQQNLTQSGDILGTLRYLPPEAFEGQVDHRGDIYALGLTLYELLVFQPAFTESDRSRLIMRISTAEAPRLDRLNAALPRDLVTMIQKCIDRDPGRRYQTAAELADDLQRFLAGEPIRARPISNLEKLLRWSRHHRELASSLAVIALLIVAVAVSATVAALRFEVSARRNARLADEKEQQRQKAEQAGKSERWERYRADIAAAASALQMQNVANAGAALAAAPPEHRNWEWDYFHSRLDAARVLLDTSFDPVMPVVSPDDKYVAACSLTAPVVQVWDSATGRPLHTLPGGPDAVAVKISPDGSRAAFATKHGLIRLVDLATGKDTAVLPAHKGKISALAFSPDGKRLASGGADDTVRLWDVATARQTAVLTDPGGAVRRIELSADGKRMVTAVGEWTLRLWDLERQQAVATLQKGASAIAIATLGFSPDSRRVLLGTDYPLNKVQIWDAVSGRPLDELLGHQNRLFGVACSPDGSRIASASQDQTVRLWDGKTTRLIAVLRGHTAWVESVAFSPDSKRLISTGADGALRLWDAVEGEPLEALCGHTDAIQGVAWSRDSRRIASVARDRTLRLWDVECTGGVLKGHASFVYDVAWRPDGAQLASAAWDGTVRLWDAGTGKEMGVLRHENDIVTSVDYAPDGKLLASVCRGNRIIVWDLATRKQRYTFQAPTGEMLRDTRAMFDPRGTRLAAATSDGRVRMWNLQSGLPAGTFRTGEGFPLDVAFRPDGARLACAGTAGIISIWDVETQRLVATLRGHAGNIHRIAYSIDGRRLASAGEDKTARVWDPETGEELLSPLLHSNIVYGVAFRPDGTRLATACADNTIRLWDTITGQEVAELRGHRAYVKAVAFSPKGDRLASASGDFTVRVWDTVPNRERVRLGVKER